MTRVSKSYRPLSPIHRLPPITQFMVRPWPLGGTADARIAPDREPRGVFTFRTKFLRMAVATYACLARGSPSRKCLATHALAMHAFARNYGHDSSSAEMS